jgi:hypothetical protein
MSFRLHGLEPIAPEGTEFVASIFDWHPLAKFCCTNWPGITARLRPLELEPDSPVADPEPEGPHSVTVFWYTHDGYWLSAVDALALADAIDASIASGAAARYLALHLNDLHKALEHITAATEALGGTRLGNGAGLTLDLLRQFSAFARTSGGFAIL